MSDEEREEYRECDRGEHDWKHLKNEGILECKTCGMVRDVEDPRLEREERTEERRAEESYSPRGPSISSIIAPLVMIGAIVVVLLPMISMFSEINEQLGENLDDQGYEEHQGTVISVRDEGGLFGSSYKATVQNDDGGISTITSSSRLVIGDIVTLYFQYERGVKKLKGWS